MIRDHIQRTRRYLYGRLLRRTFFLFRRFLLSRHRFFLIRGTGEYRHGHRSQVDHDRVFSRVPLLFLRHLDSRIYHATAAELLRVAVQDLLVLSGKRNSEAEFLMFHRDKVTDKEQCLLRFVRLPLEDHDILVIVSAVDPLEAFRLIVHFIESRLCAVQVV